MGDQGGEIEGHVHAGIGSADENAIQAGAQWQRQGGAKADAGQRNQDTVNMRITGPQKKDADKCAGIDEHGCQPGRLLADATRKQNPTGQKNDSGYKIKQQEGIGQMRLQDILDII